MKLFAVPWTVVLFVTLPETYLALEIGSRLFNIHISFRDKLIAALVTAFMEYFYRIYLTFPGANIVALIVTPTIMIILLTHMQWWKAGLCTLLGSVVVFSMEAFSDSIILPFFNLNYVDLAASPWLNIVTFLPALIFDIVILLYIMKRKLVLYNLKDVSDE